jgi:hypothetical protein
VIDLNTGDDEAAAAANIYIYIYIYIGPIEMYCNHQVMMNKKKRSGVDES